MAVGSLFQVVDRGANLAVIVALLTGFSFVGGSAAQQAAGNLGSARQSTRVRPALVDAETLLEQGRFDDAKTKVQEELERNPSSIDGYNLLGIICTDQKDYVNALDAFQHALRLDPNSTPTRNNLGNVYVAQEKLDLAEKEFRSVLRIAP